MMLCSLATATHTWLHNKLFPTPDEVRAVSAATQVTCQKLTKHTMKPFQLQESRPDFAQIFLSTLDSSLGTFRPLPLSSL